MGGPQAERVSPGLVPKAGTRIGNSAKIKLLEDGLEVRVGGYPDLQVCTVEYRPLFDRNMHRAPGDGATDEAHFAQVGWFDGTGPGPNG